MKKAFSIILVVLLFGGLSVYFLASSIMLFCKKASAVTLAAPDNVFEGSYVSSDISECGDYFLQLDHSVNYIHTHYTRYYLVPLDKDGNKLITVCAGEDMFAALDALADGDFAFAHLNGEVKALDSSTRQSVQEIQQQMSNLYGEDAPVISMYYIDLQSDGIALQFLLAGLAIPGAIGLFCLAMKLASTNKLLGNIVVLILFADLVYILYVFVVVL